MEDISWEQMARHLAVAIETRKARSYDILAFARDYAHSQDDMNWRDLRTPWKFYQENGAGFPSWYPSFAEGNADA